MNLSPLEARVLGVLIEKEITTPDQYPLSLNALTNGCNQKSNRDPVLDLSESKVQETIDGLIKKYLVRNHSGFGSRVSKFQHRFCNTEFGELKLSPQELAIMCELMLRGPQTPGELRGRAERMARFDDVEQVEKTLLHLAERTDPLVGRLPLQPGKREARYAHLIGDETVVLDDGLLQAPTVAKSPPDGGRIEALEQRIDDLQVQVTELKELVELLLEGGNKS